MDRFHDFKGFYLVMDNAPIYKAKKIETKNVELCYRYVLCVYPWTESYWTIFVKGKAFNKTIFTNGAGNFCNKYKRRLPYGKSQGFLRLRLVPYLSFCWLSQEDVNVDKLL